MQLDPQLEAYHSFVVRLWRIPKDERRDEPVENPAEEEARCRWRSELEHIQSGVRWSFETVGDLLLFLQQAAANPQRLSAALSDLTMCDQALCEQAICEQGGTDESG